MLNNKFNRKNSISEMNSNNEGLGKSAKRKFEEVFVGSSSASSSSSTLNKSATNVDKYESLLADSMLMIAEIRQLRSEKSQLIADSNADKLEIRRLNNLLRVEMKASELLKTKLKESKSSSGKF